MVCYFNTRRQKSDYFFIRESPSIFKLVSDKPEVFVCHGCHTGIRPYVLGSLHHVDDGIDRQDDAHDADGSPLTGHQRKSEEIAAHRHTCIADGRNHSDDKPQQHHRQGEVGAAVLHDEKRGDKDKCRAAVHVDGGADGQYEARHLW